MVKSYLIEILKPNSFSNTEPLHFERLEEVSNDYLEGYKKALSNCFPSNHQIYCTEIKQDVPKGESLEERAGALFTIAYNPQFTEDFIDMIKDDITPSMVSETEGETSQYQVDSINNSPYLEDYSVSDNQLLLYLIKMDINFVEF